MPKPLIISNTTVLSTPDSDLLCSASVLIQDGLIAAIGDIPKEQIPPNTRHIDGQGKLLMPGLVNSHNHCAMTLFRGMADDLALVSWLNDHIFPAEAAYVNPEMVYLCSRLAAAEMIMSGTTTVADGYFYQGEAARAFADTGIRAVAAHGVIDFPAPGVPDPADAIDTADRFIQQWLDKNPRITPAVFAHSPYTCSPSTLQQAKELTRKYNLPFFIHIAETKNESALIIDPAGETPIQHLAALDILDSQTVCVHCVWLNNQDLDLLAQNQANVVVCPQSHLKLASGMAPVNRMINQGIQVGLGTDGCASNNSLDMFREMDILAKTQKVKELEATVMPAGQVLQCATSNGAAILGLNDVGKISPGYRADLILIDMQTPNLTPFYSRDSLVYAASGADVHTVIIDGRLIMENRVILAFDLEETMAAVRHLAMATTMKN